MIINQVLQKATKTLKGNSPTPQLDAEVILAHILKKSREWILAHPEYKLSTLQTRNWQSAISKRLQQTPIAYIIEHKEFYGLDFTVNKNVLIPRPETELMVEQGLIHIKQHLKHGTVIELGTGSGCVIIALVKNLKFSSKKCLFFATDISKKALSIAKKNALKYRLINKINFFQSDLLNNQKIKSIFKKQQPIIIFANLPYLSEKLYFSTKKNVKDFEPKSALLSGQDGLNHYQKLFSQIKSLIADYPLPLTLLCEISPEQKPKIKKEILMSFPQAKIIFLKDLSGQYRLIKVTL